MSEGAARTKRSRTALLLAVIFIVGLALRIWGLAAPWQRIDDPPYAKQIYAVFQGYYSPDPQLFYPMSFAYIGGFLLKAIAWVGSGRRALSGAAPDGFQHGSDSPHLPPPLGAHGRADHPRRLQDREAPLLGSDGLGRGGLFQPVLRPRPLQPPDRPRRPDDALLRPDDPLLRPHLSGREVERLSRRRLLRRPRHGHEIQRGLRRPLDPGRSRRGEKARFEERPPDPLRSEAPRRGGHEPRRVRRRPSLRASSGAAPSSNRPGRWPSSSTTPSGISS